MSLLRNLRQTMTVARRDFTATVMTPAFLLFLLAPLIMLSFGLVGGLGARSIGASSAENTRVVMIVPEARRAAVIEIDEELRKLFPETGDESRPALRIDAPQDNVAVQARALFANDRYDIAAVLYGPLEQPVILAAPRSWIDARYLAQVAEQVLRSERAGGTEALSRPKFEAAAREGASSSGRGAVAYFAVFGIFLLTLMLAGQAVGTMAEERSNKVIEVLAAAIPLESVFLGKLIAMFGVAILFIAFWGTLLVNAAKLLPPQSMAAFADMGAAVGYPAFPILLAAYFAMSYMLLGAVFLGVGALASTQRELQMLSLPITVLQVAVFGFASYAVANPGSWVALVAEIFPFSSPSAMAGRAANSPELWPHFVALGWQALWVGVVITIGARLFRRGVLQSGNPRRRKASRNAPIAEAAIDTSVN